jgi:acetylornithine deacetylase/succinyl-diaminopimelate desuccinylase-like protein
MQKVGFMHLARKLIAANTVSANGTQGAADLLQGLWEHAGLPVQRQVVDGIHVNVLAGPGGDARGPGGVLLVTHLDTVPAGPGWRTDPWELTEKGGWLTGLGVADVKLDALCKAEAARRLQGRSCVRPFWLLGTFGEEVGLRGARHFVESEQFAAVRPAQVLVGEPSELKVISAHKGYAVVRCTLRDRKARLVSSAGPGVEAMGFAGKAAHSSTPHLGENAIQKALLYAKASGAAVLSIRGGTSSNVVPASCVLEVPAPREKGAPEPAEVQFTPAREPEPNLWRTLATASALEDLWQQMLPRDQDARFDPPGAVGGLNVIETRDGAVSMQLDARLLPSHDPDRMLEAFGAEARRWVEGLGAGEIELGLETLRNASGMAAREDSALVRAVQKVLSAHGLDAAARAKPTSTEAGIFARSGCDAVVFGPGISTGNAHTANERIEMAQLEKACDLYEAMLVELCSCT